MPYPSMTPTWYIDAYMIIMVSMVESVKNKRVGCRITTSLRYTIDTVAAQRIATAAIGDNMQVMSAASPTFAVSPTAFRSDYFFDNDGTDIVNDQTDVGDGQPGSAAQSQANSSNNSAAGSAPSSSSASPAGSPAQHPQVAPRRATLDGLAGLELSKEQRVGPFALGPVLGRGCTGTVRLGTHKETGFQVAFKIIKKKHLNSKPRLWAKVKREIAILKLIEHPNILKLYDVLETEDRLYLVLENVKGGELFDYIIAKGRLDRELSLQMIAQIVQGLEHCHAHSICHRDLKPENLLLDEKLNIKIADFGMAQLMKRNSLLKTSCGSPHYASPEIINGGAYDGKRSDVWSIGVILFALTTGSLPFDDDSLPALLNKVAKGEYRTPSHLPEDIADLISRMLTVDPLKRIPMSSIKHHSCYRGTLHFDPPLASPSATLRSIQQELRSGVDEAILADLESLGWGVKDELRTTLLNGTASDQEKVFYKLLVDRKRARIHELSRLSPKRPTRSLSLGAPNMGGMNNTTTPGIFEMEPLQPLPLPTIPGKQIVQPRAPMPQYNPAPYQEIPTGHPYSTPPAQQQPEKHTYIANIHPHGVPSYTNASNTPTNQQQTLPLVPPSIMLPQHQPVVPPNALPPLIPPSPHSAPMPSPLPSPLPSPHPNLAPLITNPQSPHYCMNSPPQTPTPTPITNGMSMMSPQPQVVGTGPGGVSIPSRLFGPAVPSSTGTQTYTSPPHQQARPSSPTDGQQQPYPPPLLFTTTSPPAKPHRVAGDLPPVAAGFGVSTTTSGAAAVSHSSQSVPAPRRRLVFRPAAVTTPATGVPLPGAANTTAGSTMGQSGVSAAQQVKLPSHVRHSSSNSPPDSPSPPTPPRHPRDSILKTSNTSGTTSPVPKPHIPSRPRSSSASATANPSSTVTSGAPTVTITRPLNLSSSAAATSSSSFGSQPSSPMPLGSATPSPGNSPVYNSNALMFPPPMAPPLGLSINVGGGSGYMATPPGSPPQSPSPDLLPSLMGIPPAHRGARSTSGGSRADVLGLTGQPVSLDRPPSSHVTHTDSRINDPKTLVLPAAARGSIASTMNGTNNRQSTRSSESPVPQIVSTPRFHRRRLVTDPNEGIDDDAMTPTTHQSPKTSWFSSIFARRPSNDVSGKLSKGASGGGVYTQKGLLQITTEVTHALGQMDIPFKAKKSGLFEVEYNTSPPAAAAAAASNGNTVINVKPPMRLTPTASSTRANAPQPQSATFFRRNTAPTTTSTSAQKAPPAADKSGKTSSAPSDEEDTSGDVLSQLTEPREPSPPPPSSFHPTNNNDDGKGQTSSVHSSVTSTNAYNTPPGRARGLSGDFGSAPSSSYAPLSMNLNQQGPLQHHAAGGHVKFSIEIVHDKAKDLRCVKFQHKSGDLSTYQRIQKDIQQRLKL